MLENDHCNYRFFPIIQLRLKEQTLTIVEYTRLIS